MPLSAASMVAMISGVTAVRGTVMQDRVRNRISPSNTACRETPLSSSLMVMVSGAGSETSYPRSASSACMWPRFGLVVGVIGLGKFTPLSLSVPAVFVRLSQSAITILQFVIDCQEKKAYAFGMMTWNLVSQSFRLLGSDKKLMVFPILSAIGAVALALPFLLALFGMRPAGGLRWGSNTWLLVFLWYRLLQLRARGLRSTGLRRAERHVGRWPAPRGVQGPHHPSVVAGGGHGRAHRPVGGSARRMGRPPDHRVLRPGLGNGDVPGGPGAGDGRGRLDGFRSEER